MVSHQWQPTRSEVKKVMRELDVFDLELKEKKPETSMRVKKAESPRIPSPPTAARSRRRSRSTTPRHKVVVTGYNLPERKKLREQMDNERFNLIHACKEKDRETTKVSTRNCTRQTTRRRQLPKNKTTISRNLYQWEIQTQPEFPTKQMQQETKAKVSYWKHGLKQYETKDGGSSEKMLKAVVTDIDSFEKRLGIH